MKKLHLLPLLFLLALTSCKDNDGSVPLNEQILGKWAENHIIRHYYDEGNQELHKETHFLTTEYAFGADSFFMNIGSKVPSNYFLTEDMGKHYIVIENSPIDRREIKIAGDKMVWNWDYLHTAYYDPATDTQKPAHRETVILEFLRVK